MLRVPIVNRVWVGEDLLPHPTAWRKAHIGAYHGATLAVERLVPQVAGSITTHNDWETLLKNFRPHRKHFNLQPPELRLSGQLLLDRVAFALRHRDKLTNDSLFHAVAVQPWLSGRNEVILRVTTQSLTPALSGN